MQRLIDLIHPEECLTSPDAALQYTQISHITEDSRQVKPGSLFFAIKGTTVDGAQYIPDALERGAEAVICDQEEGDDVGGSKIIHVPNARHVLSIAASRFYQTQPEQCVAVTGTDGKSSTVDFFRQLAVLSDHKVASVGTIGIIGTSGETLRSGSLTSLDPVSLHAQLHDLYEQHYTHVALEASSHGLDQHRLDGVRLHAAAFTNFTRDHLDYHKTVDAYFAAKRRLFDTLLPEESTAVINSDDAMSEALLEVAAYRNLKTLTYGRQAQDLRICSVDAVPAGLHAEVEVHNKVYPLEIPLVGAFQLYNILAACGLLHACGEDIAALFSYIPKLQNVPGRLQRVCSIEGADMYIDYAHTPAALQNALQCLRPHVSGKLIVVFGCGGDRDAGKRPEMGKIAGKFADKVIVTDDNPRTEDPKKIRKAIVAAVRSAKEVADRQEAIYVALKMAKKGDAVLVAGKGHEEYQIIGSDKIDYSDIAVLKEACE